MMTAKNSLIGRVVCSAAAVLATLVAGLGIPASSRAQEIGEITVTARRVEEKLKEVPLSITAFDANTIEAAGITNLTDVAALTPGLSFFNAFGENLPVPVIRGVVPQDIFGKNAAAIFVDGVYVAGREGLNFSQLDVKRIEVLKGPQSALYGRNAFSGAINYVTNPPSDVFEAKTKIGVGNRGKESIMGSISGPLFTDTLTGRVSALYDDWDGSYDNSLAPGTDIGGYRYRSLQGRLRWAPTDSFEANLGMYYSHDSIDDPATAGIPVNCEDRVEMTTLQAENNPDVRWQNWCGKLPTLSGLPDMLDPATVASANPQTLPNSVTSHAMPKVGQAVGETRDLTRGNLNLSWNPEFGSFNSLTGYSDTEGHSVSDFERSAGNSLPLIYCPALLPGSVQSGLPLCNSGDPANANNFAQLRTPSGFIDHENGGTTKEWSQELRFTSPQDQRLRYTAGGYYFHSNQRRYPGGLIATQPLPAGTTTLPDGAPDNIGIGPFPYTDGSLTDLAIGSYIFGPGFTTGGAIDPLVRMNSQEKIRSWSIFGGTDFDLTDQWQLHGEIRLTQEAQKGFNYSYKRCAQPFPEGGTINPIYTTNKFPYNTPPSADCMDDYFDLRVGGAEIGPNGPYTLEPCNPNVDSVGQDLNDGTCTPGAQKGTARFEMVTGRIGLKYQLNTDWMAYTSVAWGQKPGGIQILRPNVYTENNSIVPEPISSNFDPEKITAYEVGIKGYTSDRRVGLDMAMFYNDWTNIVLRQLTETSPTSGRTYTGLVGFNVNSGDAAVWGWEMTTDLAITDNLTGRLTAAWTDSQIKNARQDTFARFPTFYTQEPSCAPAAIQALQDPTPTTDTYPNSEGNEAQTEKARQCQAESGDVSGNTQMRQPEWTASASLSYDHPLAGEWNWFTRTDANYVGKIFIGNDNEGWMEPYTNVNFRLGVQSPRYSVEFWVRNVLENNNAIAAFRDIYWANTADLQAQAPPNSTFDGFPPLRESITYPSLRTYGLEAKMRFGAAEK